MKNSMKKITNKCWLLTFCYVFGITNIYAQGRPKKYEKGTREYNIKNSKRAENINNHNNRNPSNYRPYIRLNYRPAWSHHTRYRRRWIYFPKYNFYYDNWRQMYYYQNNTQWYMNVNLPTALININIEKENHFPLHEDEDDIDEIYKYNKHHNDSNYR
jgi:hypothetical protein